MRFSFEGCVVIISFKLLKTVRLFDYFDYSVGNLQERTFFFFLIASIKKKVNNINVSEMFTYLHFSLYMVLLEYITILNRSKCNMLYIAFAIIFALKTK